MAFDLRGKGFYIWQIRRTEAGDANAIASAAAAAGLSHVLIKIADGTEAYNLDSATGQDLVPPVIAALRGRGIRVLGWHYVYGFEPAAEADIAISRCQSLGVDAYVIDAEEQYKLPGRAAAAVTFMNRLRTSLPTLPMALSSYRYPTYHATFPWKEFLAQVDVNMPQVYWQEAHNPGEQLTRSLREFEAISPFRPIIPTGSAYYVGSWKPTASEMVEFMDTARSLNMSAANFWEWAHTRLYLPDLWNAIAAYNWPVTPPPAVLPEGYFSALNAHSVEQVVALYQPNAVHVTPDRTLQGTDAIREWYQDLLGNRLPNGVFTLGEQSSTSGARHFAWTATSTKGNVSNGRDSMGLVDGKIAYHYTWFTIG